MSTAILVGNPKSHSRTYDAAELLVHRLSGRGPDQSFDLIDIAPSLLDRSDPAAKEVIAAIQEADLLVVTNPTYTGRYTGLLKLFFDRVEAGAFAGVTAVPLMPGGDWCHALAPEVFLKPVLAELGAACPTRGLFLLDSDYQASDALVTWIKQATPQLGGLLGAVG